MENDWNSIEDWNFYADEAIEWRWWVILLLQERHSNLHSSVSTVLQTMASELRQSPGHLDEEFGSCSGHTFDDPVDEVIISTNSVEDGGSEWEWWWEWSPETPSIPRTLLFSFFCFKWGELFLDEDADGLFRLLVELFFVNTPFVTDSNFGESFPLPCWGPQQVWGTQFPVSPFLGHSRTQSLSSSGCTLYCKRKSSH